MYYFIKKEIENILHNLYIPVLFFLLLNIQLFIYILTLQFDKNLIIGTGLSFFIFNIYLIINITFSYVLDYKKNGMFELYQLSDVSLWIYLINKIFINCIIQIFIIFISILVHQALLYMNNFDIITFMTYVSVIIFIIGLVNLINSIVISESNHSFLLNFIFNNINNIPSLIILLYLIENQIEVSEFAKYTLIIIPLLLVISKQVINIIFYNIKK